MMWRGGDLAIDQAIGWFVDLPRELVIE